MCCCSGCVFSFPLRTTGRRWRLWERHHIFDGHAFWVRLALLLRLSKDGEGEALPLCRKLWCEVQLFVANLHAAELLYYRHPCSRHRSDVQPFEPHGCNRRCPNGGAQIHFVGFLGNQSVLLGWHAHKGSTSSRERSSAHRIELRFTSSSRRGGSRSSSLAIRPLV